MVNRKFGILFLMLIMLTTFSSALDDLGTKKLDEQFTFCQVCYDATYITLSSIETPSNTEILNANMDSLGSGQYCYNYTATEIGRYDFRGVSDGCEKTFAVYVDVTLSGVDRNMTLIIADIFIILALSLVVYILHITYRKNRGSNSNSSLASSHNGNWGQTFAKTVGRNLMKESFLWYYMLGWLILIVFRDLVMNFNSIEIYNFFVLFMDLYSFGFFIIIAVWIGILINHFKIVTDIIQDLNMGIEK